MHAQTHPELYFSVTLHLTKPAVRINHPVIIYSPHLLASPPLAPTLALFSLTHLPFQLRGREQDENRSTMAGVRPAVTPLIFSSSSIESYLEHSCCPWSWQDDFRCRALVGGNCGDIRCTFKKRTLHVCEPSLGDRWVSTAHRP